MSFAQTYLERYASGSWTELAPPDPDLLFSIIIPVLDEDFLPDTLNSLVLSIAEDFVAEIILVYNHPETAAEEVRARNETSRNSIIHWSATLPGNIRVQILGPVALPESLAGPGYPRKLGMDLAIKRFHEINQPAGLLVSMDADAVVDRNFFHELAAFFKTEARAQACTVYFEHPRVFGGQVIEDPEAMIHYEIYLRVVKLGLQWAGYPLAIHTLGSAFSLKAGTYVKAGGMGRHRSGEDFYFLHKCIQLGDFWENNAARVYPSGRKSDRVVFGTGKFIRDYRIQYPSGFQRYSWKAFTDLAALLGPLSEAAYSDLSHPILKNLTPTNQVIAKRLNWEEKLNLAQEQAGNQDSFRKWIWRQLDGLQMVHYLNMHQEESGSEPVIQTACQLLSELGVVSCPMNPALVLSKLRSIERSSGVRRVY